MAELFYPGHGPNDDLKGSKCRAKLLASLDDEAYWDMYRRISTTPMLRFPPIQPLLSLSAEEGRILRLVPRHVVLWLNATATPTIGGNDNKKPGLRIDMMPALHHCTPEFIYARERALGLELGSETMAVPTEAASILLQHEVLEYTRSHIKDFKRGRAKAWLELPNGPTEGAAVNEAGYAVRFSDEDTWAGILAIVRSYVGPDFRAEWTAKAVEVRGQDSTVLISPAEQARNLASFLKKDGRLSPAATCALASPKFAAALTQWFSERPAFLAGEAPCSGSDGEAASSANDRSSPRRDRHVDLLQTAAAAVALHDRSGGDQRPSQAGRHPLPSQASPPPPASRGRLATTRTGATVPRGRDTITPLLDRGNESHPAGLQPNTPVKDSHATARPRTTGPWTARKPAWMTKGLRAGGATRKSGE